MKIVIINPSLNCGGSEKVISQLANFWAEKGYNVTIITTDRGEKSYFLLNEKVQRIAILKGRSTSRLFSVPRKFLSIIKLRQKLIEVKPDIVYVFQEKTIIYTLIGLLGVGLVKVAAIRNHPEYKKLPLLYSFLRSLLYKRANVIVVQTEGIKNWFAKKGYQKLKVIPNPITLNKEVGKSAEDKTIVACGRLVPQKGFDKLLEVFCGLTEEMPDWQVQIIGDGPEYKKLSKKTTELGIEDKVTFLGYQKNPSRFYSKAGVFSFTSDYEGFPNALCEAMVAGMAVVSYDCPSGPSDLVIDGENGFLVPLGDMNLFKERLRQVMKDVDLRLAFSKEAVKIADKLNMTQVALAWEELAASVSIEGE